MHRFQVNPYPNGNWLSLIWLLASSFCTLEIQWEDTCLLQAGLFLKFKIQDVHWVLVALVVAVAFFVAFKMSMWVSLTFLLLLESNKFLTVSGWSRILLFEIILIPEIIDFFCSYFTLHIKKGCSTLQLGLIASKPFSSSQTNSGKRGQSLFLEICHCCPKAAELTGLILRRKASAATTLICLDFHRKIGAAHLPKLFVPFFANLLHLLFHR